MRESEKVERVRDRLKSVLPLGVGVVLFDFFVLSMDLMLMAGDVLFYPVSVFTGSVAANVDWVSSEALMPLVAWLALFYVANVVLSNLRRFR